jgi:hypothetical protein
MQILMLRNTFGADRTLYAAGTQYDVADTIALTWIGTGAAVDVGSAREDQQGTNQPAGGGALGPYADLATLISSAPAASNSGKTAMVGAAAPYAQYNSDGVNWYRFGDRVQQIKLLKWKKALANIRTGSARAKILIMGDSTQILPQADQCPARYMAKILTGMGIPAHDGSTMGPHGAALNGSLDSRVVYSGSGISVFSGVASGAVYGFATGATIDFTPQQAFDSFRVIHQVGASTGTYSWAIDGGAANNIVVGAASDTYASTANLTTTLGTHTIRLAFVSGSVGIVGIETWNSTSPSISIINAAVGGSAAAAWTLGTRTPASFHNAIAADLTVFDLGTNDTGASATTAFPAAVDTLTTAITGAGGDILLAVFGPNQGWQGEALSLANTRREYVRKKAQVSGLASYDMYRRWGEDWAIYNANGMFTDLVHPNALVQAERAQAIVEALMGWTPYPQF